MSADKPDFMLSVAVFWGLFGSCGVVLANDEQPDMEFLEYLGSWEESDEDWLLFNNPDREAVVADEIKRSEPVPPGKESPEKDDES